MGRLTMDRAELMGHIDQVWPTLTFDLDTMIKGWLDTYPTEAMTCALQLAMLDRAAVLAMTFCRTTRKEFERAASEVYGDYRPDRGLADFIERRRIVEGNHDGDNNGGQVPGGTA